MNWRQTFSGYHMVARDWQLVERVCFAALHAAACPADPGCSRILFQLKLK
jgi:hypothetical protein